LATHLPGLLYLVALNSIAGDDPPLDGAVLQVLLYNAISFSVPVAAFVLADRHAVGTQARITELSAWVRRHQRGLLVAVFAGVGTYLLAKGMRAPLVRGGSRAGLHRPRVGSRPRCRGGGRVLRDDSGRNATCASPTSPATRCSSARPRSTGSNG
jgi:hypothetical protein